MPSVGVSAVILTTAGGTVTTERLGYSFRIEVAVGCTSPAMLECASLLSENFNPYCSLSSPGQAGRPAARLVAQR
jgi:hypothetical protein